MVLPTVTVLAGLSAILSTSIIGANAEPRDHRHRPNNRHHGGRNHNGRHHHHDEVQTVTQFITVPVYPEYTDPPVASVSVPPSYPASVNTPSGTSISLPLSSASSPASSVVRISISNPSSIPSSAASGTSPPVLSSSAITYAVLPPSSSAPPLSAASTKILSAVQSSSAIPSSLVPLSPTSTFSLILVPSSVILDSTSSNYTVGFPSSTGPGNLLTSIQPEPTVCPGFDETILETIWTTMFNTVTATVIA